MRPMNHRRLALLLGAGLAVSLTACHKNKDVETDAAADPPPAANAAEATVGGEPVVEAAAFHPNRAADVVKENMGAVTACFQGHSAQKVVVSLTVAADGSVSSAKANAGHPNVDSCLSGAFKTMTFPEPRGGEPVSVKIPISYVP